MLTIARNTESPIIAAAIVKGMESVRGRSRVTLVRISQLLVSREGLSGRSSRQTSKTRMRQTHISLGDIDLDRLRTSAYTDHALDIKPDKEPPTWLSEGSYLWIANENRGVEFVGKIRQVGG